MFKSARVYASRLPAAYTEHKDCPSIVKHTLGTHLGNAVLSNDDASECDQSEVATSSRSMSHHSTARASRPHWFQHHSRGRVLIKIKIKIKKAQVIYKAAGFTL